METQNKDKTPATQQGTGPRAPQGTGPKGGTNGAPQGTGPKSGANGTSQRTGPKSAKRKSGLKDLTVGNPSKVILLYALPVLGSFLVQQLYSAVDLIFVGQFIGKEASSAVGSSDLLITCIVGLFTGISVGSGVVAAQTFGAGDRKTLKKLIQTVYTFSLLGAAVLFVLGQLLAPTFLHWLSTPEEVYPVALTYLRVYFISVFAIIMYNLGSGIIRSLGDSAAAFRFQIYGGLFNVVTDFIFIYFFRWGVAGAAAATALSQILSAFLVLRYLAKLDEDIALKLKEFYMVGKLLKKVLAIGIPSGIQSMVITFSNLFIQSIINSFGVDVMAAFAAYFKIELFLYYPIIAYGQALVTYTAQNIGAGKEERVHKGLITTLIMSLVTVGGLAIVGLAAGRPLFAIFNGDPEVIANGLKIMHVTFPLYVIYTVQESFGSVCKGRGYARTPMLIIVGCMCICRVIAINITTSIKWVVESIAIVYPITWALAGICMLLYYMWLMKRLKNKKVVR